MMFCKSLLFIAVLLSCCLLSSGQRYSVKSPGGGIEATIGRSDDGRLSYTISNAGRLVLLPSRLGITRKDADLTAGLKVLGVARAPVSGDYTLLTGKKKQVHYEASSLQLNCRNRAGQLINIIFQVSDDGVAFRYMFPGDAKGLKVVMRESTTFKFPLQAKAWLGPHRRGGTGWEKTQPSYEEYYEQEIAVTKPSHSPAGWSFPALFHSNGSWVLLSEADMDKAYAGSHLAGTSPGGEYKIRYPDPVEGREGGPVYPEHALPWKTPWRCIIIGSSLSSIVASDLITDLSAPALEGQPSYIKPGRAAWTWPMLKDSATRFDIQQKQIDLAGEMGWEYCLIDAFWDVQIGEAGIRKLAAYAKSKGVGILLWYNSAGQWNTTPLTPRNKLLTHDSRRKEFSLLREMGIKGIKVDFFGGDGQSMMRYYQDILEDAAAYQLLVNFHGATIPRGWNRSYPNLMTMEAVRGFEYETFSQANADKVPSHCAMLPFTRNVIGPMDFTPVTFQEIPGIKRRTSNAFELALSVLFQSGIQHYGLLPSDFMGTPDYVKRFLQGLPSIWEEVRLVDGYPGRYCILARRSSGGWYIAGINADTSTLRLNLDLAFAGGKGRGRLITDGDGPRSFRESDIPVDEKGKLNISLRPKGGFVLYFPEQASDGYIFPYFKGNGEDGLHLAASRDGYQWSELHHGQSVMTPTVGGRLLRDPSIIRGGDGLYHMVYTSGWYDKGFGYAASADLVHWSPQQFIPVMGKEPLAKNVWAPELFYDDSSGLYYIIWATTIPGRFPATDASSEDHNNHRLYYTTTRDFISFSTTALFYDQGFNVIDGFLFRWKGKYNLFLKDETMNPPQKNIRIATAETAAGPYSKPSPPITGNYWAEGPTVFRVRDSVIVYFDRYRDGKYGALRTSDLEHWEDISDRISLPAGIRHGSIFAVPLSILEKLK